MYHNVFVSIFQKSESAHEKKQYDSIADEISWFFTNLFIFGYVEDASTGVSFRLPSDSEWTVYVEVWLTITK